MRVRNGHTGGTSDPARSLALLWGARTQARARGRLELSLEKIVLAAIQVADADGLDALSMRRIAGSLGVSVMSLYTYVPGKAELIDVMLDTVYGETIRPRQVPDGWRSRLELVGRENWALCRRHPWILQVCTGRPRLGPRAIAKYDYELSAVEGIGLTSVEMDAVVSLVVDHAENTARRVAEAARLEQDSGMTDEQWWRVHGPLLSALTERSRFPTATRVGSAVGVAHGTPYPAEYAYEFGLRRLLDGVAMLVRARMAHLSRGSVGRR